MAENLHYLLAVDIGLHTGLAFFSSDRELLWYRSHHVPNPATLKKLVASVLRQQPRPTHLYLEGGGQLADIWIKDAEKLVIPIHQLQAHHWRPKFFYQRQHSNRNTAKKEADTLARQVIAKLGGKKPTSLRHDAAEAVLIGLFALIELGWIPEWPNNF